MYPHPVVKLILALGNTADEIAATLERGGFRGLREMGDHCPIARYLRHHGYPATVNALSLEADERQWHLSVQLAEFVGRFDEGAYPNLVEQP